ncbi:replication terminator protein [Oceanobacillus kimchii]|uniref:replication terminator protein n=1 Tax=Oceanobacillus TaxID=182709 RepID=UPI0021A4AE32|nr:replication terminator protein [Oceanobacillus kimchii]MCT1577969.1 replication terminator protein [Oceanobacillus kimchii]MCT2137529.1 replication terminator protein [Oceanobacillus kimchii]
MDKQIVDLNEFAGGAVAERFNLELQKVLENFTDLNTDPTAKRKINLTVTLVADDARDVVKATVQAKTTLAPAKELESKILMDYDDGGDVTGAELKSGIKGQSYVDMETGEIKEDTGNKIYSFKNPKGEVQ